MRIALISLLMFSTSLVFADNKADVFDKLSMDKFFHEKDISKRENNVCRLYIKSNVSKQSIIIRIEDDKSEGKLVIKGAEKEKLNYFYKYIKDGSYSISETNIKSFFDYVKNVKFMNYKRSDYDLKTGPSRKGDRYLIECKLDEKYNIETGNEKSKEISLFGIPNKMQMLAASTVPKGTYNVDKELRADYSKLMEEIKEPICSQDVDEELTIFSVVPYFDEDDKKMRYPKLLTDKKVKGYMFGFLLKYVLKNNEYFLKFRNYNHGFLGAVVQPLMDIDQIKRFKVDKLMEETNKKLESVKIEPPEFIWKHIGYEYITVYKKGSNCYLFYDIRKCVGCKFSIIDNIWGDIRKNIEHLFYSAAGKRKVYEENPD